MIVLGVLDLLVAPSNISFNSVADVAQLLIKKLAFLVFEDALSNVAEESCA